jgi:hypothetical protein
MRAFEFLREDKKEHDHHGLHNPQIGGVHIMPNIEQGYQLYRLGIDLAVAGSDDPKWPGEQGHPAGEHTVIVAYSDGDNKMVDQVLKKRGGKHKPGYDDPGKEDETINRTSPVATRKRNRYGV